MPPKKKSEEPGGNISQDLIKKYGNVFFSGQNIIENPKEIISVSPKLDIALGGGICAGSIATLAGKPKSGKSTLALCMARNAQKVGYKVIYADIEHRLKKRDLEGVKDLNISEIEIIRSVKGKILTGEEYLSIIESIINNQNRVFIIADSISQLCLEIEYTSNLEDRNRSPGSLLLSKFFKRCAGALAVNNNILVCVQHLIANLGNTTSHGPMYVKSGGFKIGYCSDMALVAKSVKVDKTNANDIYEKNIGQTVEWLIEYSSLSTPGTLASSYIRYGIGVCDITENISIAIDLGLIKTAGAGWTTLSYLGSDEIKLQGQEKIYHYFNSNDGQKNYQLLQEKIKKILQS